jgi:hypothetical protein
MSPEAAVPLGSGSKIVHTPNSVRHLLTHRRAAGTSRTPDRMQGAMLERLWQYSPDLSARGYLWNYVTTLASCDAAG